MIFRDFSEQFRSVERSRFRIDKNNCQFEDNYARIDHSETPGATAASCGQQYLDRMKMRKHYIKIISGDG
jgi:hypothetical protein